MEPIRIHLDNPKAWWDIRPFLNLALERDFVDHAIKAQATLHDSSPELVQALIDPADELVVRCSLAWSYDEEVSVRILREEVPGHHYHTVAEKMGDIYSPLVVKAIEVGQRTYSSLLKAEETRNGSLSPS